MMEPAESEIINVLKKGVISLTIRYFLSLSFWLAVLLPTSSIAKEVSQVHADEKPVIAYADANGDIALGVWGIKIEIFKDGKVHYFGEGDVYAKGDRYTRIAPAKLKKLIESFVNAQFFEMELSISTLWSRWHPPLLTPPVILYRNRQTPPTIVFNYQGHERTVEMEGSKIIYELKENILRTVDLKQWVCFPPSVDLELSENCKYWYEN